ncbi:MAG: hypothetical protein AAFP08_14910 [Bacteroidota bacterium]
MTRLQLFIEAIIFLAIGQFLALSWWIPLAAIFGIVLLYPVRNGGTFTQGFWAGLLVWGGIATYLHWSNQGILGDRLATTFGLPDGWLLVLVTGLWGAIGAGLAAWAGQAVRQTVKPIAKA